MEQSKRHGFNKKWWWGIGGLGFVLLTVLLMAKFYLDPWVEEKLAAQVQKQSNGVYLLHTGKVHVSLLGGSVSIDSFRLIHQDAVWQKLQQQNPAQAKPMGVTLQAARVQVTGINFLRLLQQKPLQLTRVQLDKPSLLLVQLKPDTTQARPLHEKLTGQWRNLAVQNILVKDGHLRYKSSPLQKTDDLELRQLQANARDLVLDSASFQDPARAFYCQDIKATVAGLDLLLPKKYYRLKAGALQVSTRAKGISANHVRLVPQLSARGFARKAGRAIARFNVAVPVVSFSGVNFHAFSRYGNVQMGGVRVVNPQVRAYMDCKNFPIKGEQPLPHDLVQAVPFGLNIRKVAIQSLDVHYKELAPTASTPGTLFVKNINAQIHNLTNDKNLMTSKKPAVVKASGLLMGQAYLAATVRLPLLDKGGAHTMVGRIGKGNPAVLNQMLEPLLHMSIKSGRVEKGSFQVSLNRTSASGTMHIQYDDFKVDLLSKDGEKRQSVGKKLLSFAANKLVIDSDSPANGQEPARVPIQVTRRTNRSVLSYWKDCLADGTLQALGVPKK